MSQPPSPYSNELTTALHAVHLASVLTKSLLPASDKGFRSKSDLSPVTIADYASQAILIATIHHAFPRDSVLGEESASTLRTNPTLCDRVWNLISGLRETFPEDVILNEVLGSRDDMFRYIDEGFDGQGGGEGRIWMLDPLDGTRAFMKGEQYAICLALVEDGGQRLGVVGCPNLPFGVGNGDSDGSVEVKEDVVDGVGLGSLLYAVKGEGAFVCEMKADGLGESRKIEINEEPPEILRIVQPSNVAYDFDKARRATDSLGCEWPGTQIWSQQMRFVALALGEGNVQIAFRSKRGYHSYIWDLAGGVLIYEEAGGKITDGEGKELDFGQGRRMEKNWGVVAALATIHERVLAAAREADEGEEVPHVNGNI